MFLSTGKAEFCMEASFKNISIDIYSMAKKKLAYPRFSARNLDRYPRLDTVLMVEEALYKYMSDKTIRQIWLSLPTKVMWSTYTTILDYLEYSGKIIVEDDRTVSWIWDPAGVRKTLANPKLVVK
jgi:hypothetical protein